MEKIFLAFVILLQQVSIPFVNKISIVLIVVYIYLFFTLKNLRLSYTRLVIFGILILSVITSFFVSLFIRNHISVFSFLLFIVIYFPFIFVKKITHKEFIDILKAFNDLMLLMVGLQIFQIIYYFGSHNFISFRDLLPRSLQLRGFNTEYFLFNYFYYKPNAVFFLEPSFLSQYLSLAIIIEFLYFRRYIRLFIFVLGLILTLSGAGWILLLFAILSYGALEFILIIKGKNIKVVYNFLIFLFMVCIVLYLVNLFLLKCFCLNGITFLKNRTSEFFIPNTSGHMRFIAPYVSIFYIDNSFLNLLFGFGAGSVKFLKLNLPFDVAFTALPKLFLEYGVFSLISYILFLYYTNIAKFSHKSKIIAFSIVFMNLFLSGALLQPHTIYLMYFLVSLYSFKKRGKNVHTSANPPSSLSTY